MKDRSPVLYLVPDFFGPPGGIAMHSRTVAGALGVDRWPVVVLALNDRPDINPRRQRDYTPCGKDRLSFILHACRTLRRRPAVILLGHANFSLVGWVLARLCGARLVVFLHGIESWQRFSLLRLFALRHADAWIAVSCYTADRAAAANDLSRDRVAVLHHCLPAVIDGVDDRECAGLSILSVGRIAASETYKGYGCVIRAMPGLLKRFPDLIYHVVGDGDGRPHLEALARREGVVNAVRFHGVISGEDLSRLYSETTVFVMPSSGEGFGYVFLEAMAYGLPIVAGNADATPEVVSHGETGLLVQPSSTDQIVSAVSRLLSDRPLRERMGRAGMQRVRNHFSPERFQAELLACLSEASRPRGKSSRRESCNT